MKISIITVVYNRKNTIARAMKSIQNQSYQNIEHIIQDGGSTDGTIDIIKDLSNSKTLLESSKDQGIYDAINKGIKRTTGDIIGLLHSDDLFAEKDVLYKIVRAFKNSKIHATYGDLEYFSYKDSKKIVRKWTAGSFCKDKLYRGWMPPHPTLFLRREALVQFGYYDTKYKIAADYDFILRCFGTGDLNLFYINDVVVKMSTGGTSNKSLRNIIHKSYEDYRILKSHNIGGFMTLFKKNILKVKQFF